MLIVLERMCYRLLFIYLRGSFTFLFSRNPLNAPFLHYRMGHVYLLILCNNVVGNSMIDNLLWIVSIRQSKQFLYIPFFLHEFVNICFIMFFLTWVREIQGRLNIPSVSQFHGPVNMAHLGAADTCLRKVCFLGGGSVGRVDMAQTTNNK